MSARKDGGPAFPTLQPAHSHYVENEHGLAQSVHSYAVDPGMTLRDYFAAKALPACLHDYFRDARERGWDPNWQEGVAMDAYAMADAMLRARERTP